jgi:hypothetical protein
MFRYVKGRFWHKERRKEEKELGRKARAKQVKKRQENELFTTHKTLNFSTLN